MSLPFMPPTTMPFTPTAAPRRNCPSLAMTTFAPVSATRNRSASAENPPQYEPMTYAEYMAWYTTDYVAAAKS